MPKTPICPACGAKFAHSAAMLACVQCGLPDEVIRTGKVGLWKANKLKDQNAPRVKFSEPGNGASKSKRPHKHGRIHVRRNTKQTNPVKGYRQSSLRKRHRAAAAGGSSGSNGAGHAPRSGHAG